MTLHCGLHVIFSEVSASVFDDFFKLKWLILKNKMGVCVCLCVKFCFLLGKTAVETVTMLKEAFKDKSMGKTREYEWFNRFKRGEMCVEDQLSCSRPSTSGTNENVEKSSPGRLCRSSSDH